MANGISKTIRNKLLDHLLKKTAFVQPEHIYIGLFTTMPDADGLGGQEVLGLNYVRVLADNWDAAAEGSAANTDTISFQTPGLDGWGTIVGFGVFDTLAAGTLLFKGLLGADKLTTQGDSLYFSPGQIVLNLQ